MSFGLDPFVSSAQEAQPPLALETAEKCVPLLDRSEDVGVARMYEDAWALPPQPAVPVRKLLSVARIEASPNRRCALLPGIGQEPPQHAVERAIAGRKLDHFTHAARAHVVEVPPDQPPPTFEHGTRTQLSMARLSGRLLEQPGERARIVVRLQGVAVCDIGKV